MTELTYATPWASPSDPKPKPDEPEKAAFACSSYRGLEHQRGMTMRDYFAAHCPITIVDAKILWQTQCDLAVENGTSAVPFDEYYIQSRWKYATDMMEQREVE